MRRVVLLAMLCWLASTSNAQEVLYSAYDKFNVNGGDFSVVGKLKGLVYTYRSTNEGYFLDAYDDSMNKQATVILDFFPEKIYEVKFIAYPDKIMVLYQSLLGNTLIQQAALLDEKGRLLKNPVTLDKVKTGIFGPTRDYFDMVHSNDKKHIVVYKAWEERKGINFSGYWLDDNLNLTHRLTTLYTNDKGFNTQAPAVSNQGTFFLPAASSEGLKGYSQNFSLLTVPFGAKKFTALSLPLGEKFMTDNFIKIDDVNGKLYLSGFYALAKNGNFDGVIYAVQNLEESDWAQKKFYPFSDSLRRQTGERNTKRAFNDFNIKQLITKKDGGFVLLAESNFINLRTDYRNGFGYYSFYYNPVMNRTVREYYYGDVLALSYDGEGQIEWYNFIRKNQYSFEDGGVFSSYGLLNTGNELALLFNDFDLRRSSMQLAIIDAQGKTQLKSMGNTGQEDPDWLPRSGKQVSAHEMIVPCLARKKLCFAKIIY